MLGGTHESVVEICCRGAVMADGLMYSGKGTCPRAAGCCFMLSCCWCSAAGVLVLLR